MKAITFVLMVTIHFGNLMEVIPDEPMPHAASSGTGAGGTTPLEAAEREHDDENHNKDFEPGLWINDDPDDVVKGFCYTQHTDGSQRLMEYVAGPQDFVVFEDE